MKILRRNYSFSELIVFRSIFIRLILNPTKLLNLLLVKISSYFRLERDLGLPINLHIEPTGDCNYRCVKCGRFSDDYRDDGPVNDSKNMPFDHFRQIIDELGDTLISLRLWHYGEPLLNNDLFKMIRYAKKKNIIVAVSSNMSLVTSDVSKDLVASGLDYLIVSLDGATEDTYSRYHGKSYFNDVIKNIETLGKAKKALNSSFPFVELQFVIMKDNENEIDRIKDLSKELEIDKLTFIRLDKSDINYSAFTGFESEVDILPRNDHFRLDLNAINAEKRCRIPWENALIRYSGLVLPCITDLGQKNEMGRLFENGRYAGFKSLWNSQRYRRFRRQTGDRINQNSFCIDCVLRNNNIYDQVVFHEED